MKASLLVNCITDLRSFKAVVRELAKDGILINVRVHIDVYFRIHSEWQSQRRMQRKSTVEECTYADYCEVPVEVHLYHS